MAKNKGFDLNTIIGEIPITPEEKAEREYIKNEEYRLGIHMGFDMCYNKDSDVPYSSVHRTIKDWKADCEIAHRCLDKKEKLPKDVEERLLITRKERYGNS